MDSYQDLTVGFSLQESPWSECVSKCHAYIMCGLLNMRYINMHISRQIICTCQLPHTYWTLFLSYIIYVNLLKSSNVFYWYIFASYMLVIIETLQIIHQNQPCVPQLSLPQIAGKMALSNGTELSTEGTILVAPVVKFVGTQLALSYSLEKRFGKPSWLYFFKWTWGYCGNHLAFIH